MVAHNLILYQHLKINQASLFGFGHISILVQPFVSAQLSSSLNCFCYDSPKCPFYLNKSNEWPDCEARTGRGETLKQRFFHFSRVGSSGFATSMHQAG